MQTAMKWDTDSSQNREGSDFGIAQRELPQKSRRYLKLEYIMEYINNLNTLNTFHSNGMKPGKAFS